MEHCRRGGNCQCQQCCQRGKQLWAFRWSTTTKKESQPPVRFKKWQTQPRLTEHRQEGERSPGSVRWVSYFCHWFGVSFPFLFFFVFSFFLFCYWTKSNMKLIYHVWILKEVGSKFHFYPLKIYSRRMVFLSENLSINFVAPSMEYIVDKYYEMYW